jgi:hypothetical protein
MPFQFAHSLTRPLFNNLRGVLSPSEPEIVLPAALPGTGRIASGSVKNTTPAGADRDLVLELIYQSEEFGEISFGTISTTPPGAVSTFGISVLFIEPDHLLLRVHPTTGASWSGAEVLGNLTDCPNFPGDATPKLLTTEFQDVVPPRQSGQRLTSIFGSVATNERAAIATVTFAVKRTDGSLFLFPPQTVPAGSSTSIFGDDHILSPGESVVMKVDPGVGNVYFFSDWLNTPAARSNA